MLNEIQLWKFLPSHGFLLSVYHISLHLLYDTRLRLHFSTYFNPLPSIVPPLRFCNFLWSFRLCCFDGLKSPLSQRSFLSWFCSLLNLWGHCPIFIPFRSSIVSDVVLSHTLPSCSTYKHHHRTLFWSTKKICIVFLFCALSFRSSISSTQHDTVLSCCAFNFDEIIRLSKSPRFPVAIPFRFIRLCLFCIFIQAHK